MSLKNDTNASTNVLLDGKGLRIPFQFLSFPLVMGLIFDVGRKHKFVFKCKLKSRQVYGEHRRPFVLSYG